MRASSANHHTITRPVAVTGATGFIGRHLLAVLEAEGLRVRALTRQPQTAGLPATVETVVGSLEDEDSLDRLLAGVDAVVHCAGLIKAADLSDFARVNAAGTERIARSAARQGVGRLVFLSSLAARLPTLSPYAASKSESEARLAASAGDLEWIVLRPPAVYGPGDRETLPLFRLMRRGLLPVPRLPTARVSLIHVDDLCRAIVTLLRCHAGTGATYELRDAAPTGYTWADLAAAAGRHLGRRVTCLPLPRSVLLALARANEGAARLTGGLPLLSRGKVNEFFHPDWVCSENPLTTVTDWRPKVDLDQGFAETLRWYGNAGWL